jgi:hypothetical protein
MSLKMTETYATTVAAVAPVILLVAAVEVQQITRNWREVSAQMVEAYGEAMRGLATAGTDASRAELHEMAKPVLEASARATRARDLRFGLFFTWVATSIALFLALAGALVWLADDGRAAEPWLAWLCLLALLWGTAAVVGGSIILAMGTVVRESRGARAFMEALQHAHEQQQQPRD